MRLLKLFVLLASCSFAMYSCTKKKADTPGKGGSASLMLYPQHHGVERNLSNMKVYIKYNTQVPPSNGVYDDSIACTMTDTMSVGTFSGLNNGPYYLYGYGYDTSIHENVKGGIPYTISTQSSQTVLLPVSED